MTKEALKMALETLIQSDSEPSSKQWKRETEAITAIKEALAQPEQEPVAWETFALKFANGTGLSYEKPKNLPTYLGCRPLYTTPPPVAEPHKQEPVAWMLGHRIYDSLAEANADWQFDPAFDNTGYTPTPLYTTPPQRKPLTDEEVRKHLAIAKSHEQTWLMFARAIEAAHGIKGEA